MVRRLTSQVASHMQCDACQGGGAVNAPTAKIYCVDCCESLCKPCSVDHRQNSSFSGHELVKLRNRRPSRPDKYLSKLPAAPCPTHPNESRDMYCVDCSVTVCRRCLAVQHKSHRAGEVQWLASRLRDRIEADVARMQQSVARCRTEMEKLRRTREQFETRYAG